MSLKESKKGSILDGMYITVIALALFLGFATGKIVWDKVTEDQTIWNESTPAATKIMNRYDDQYMPMADGFFVLAISGGYIAIFILAYFIRGSPIFLPIMLILMAINQVLATMVSNIHYKILASSTVVSTTVAGWTMTDALLSNLPLISFIYLVGLTITMLAFGDTI